MGLLMATLGFDHVTGGFDLAAGGYSVLWLLTLTWLSGGAIIMFEQRRTGSARVEGGLAMSLALHVLISLGVFFVFTIVHHTVVSYEPTVESIDDLLSFSHLLSNTIVVYYVAAFSIILLVAWALTREIRRPRALARWPSVAVLIPLTGIVLVLVLLTNVNIVRADIQYKQGLNWDDAQQWDASIAQYEESIRLAPQQDWYHLDDAFAPVHDGFEQMEQDIDYGTL